MRILGLDTATRATAVAVCEVDGGRVQREFEGRDDPAPGARPGHGAQLLPLIFAALARSEASWDEVDRIAVGVGPGTFTGLRIGIATARAIADARSIPLVGVTSLQALACLARPLGEDRGAELLAAVIDARRGELFAAAWEPAQVDAPDAMPTIPARAYPPHELAAAVRATGARLMAVGDGAIPFRDLLEQCGALVPPDDSGFHRVSAIGHCRLGAAIELDPAHPVGDISPMYLRAPDAERSRRATQHDDSAAHDPIP
jgi:tRNA threonylcarbamoyladenosine biosynthesis protein TsaB